MPVMQFGKYQGVDFKDVPEDYWNWIIKNSEDKILEAKAELERRKIKVENSYMARIVELGFNAMIADPSNDQNKCGLARKALLDAIRDAAQPKGTSP